MQQTWLKERLQKIPIFVAVIDFVLTAETEFIAALERKLQSRQRCRGVKILIRATNWVGDAIMALPALRAVRSRFPDAQITILARPYVASIYKNQQVCDNVMFVDEKRNMVSELRAQKFDAALLLQNAFQAAWLAWRAGIPERIGYARDGRSLLLTKAVPVPRAGEIPVHEQYYYLELLRRAGWLDSLPKEVFHQTRCLRRRSPTC